MKFKKGDRVKVIKYTGNADTGKYLLGKKGIIKDIAVGVYSINVTSINVTVECKKSEYKSWNFSADELGFESPQSLKDLISK